MPLTKTPQVPLAEQSQAVGAARASAWLPIGYGVSGAGRITNGAAGPSASPDFVIELAQNDSGLNAIEWRRQGGFSLAANAVSRIPFGLGIGGEGGDFSHYRLTFTAPSGQPVETRAFASSTTEA